MDKRLLVLSLLVVIPVAEAGHIFRVNPSFASSWQTGNSFRLCESRQGNLDLVNDSWEVRRPRGGTEQLVGDSEECVNFRLNQTGKWVVKATRSRNTSRTENYTFEVGQGRVSVFSANPAQARGWVEGSSFRICEGGLEKLDPKSWNLTKPSGVTTNPEADGENCINTVLNETGNWKVKARSEEGTVFNYDWNTTKNRTATQSNARTFQIANQTVLGSYTGAELFALLLFGTLFLAFAYRGWTFPVAASLLAFVDASLHLDVLGFEFDALLIVASVLSTWLALYILEDE